jgi:hypothetical protein
MVSKRNLVILAGVLVVLLAINFFQKQGHERRTSRPATEVLIPGTQSADELGRITIGHGEDGGEVVLGHGPTGWVVETAWDAPANEARLGALLRNLSDLTGEFRAENPDVLADFQLDRAAAVRIRASGRDGQEAFALDIGGKPERANGNFVRVPGSDRVYLTQTNLLASLGLYAGPDAPKSSHFIDLQAVQEDRRAVDRIVLDDGGAVLEMAKEFAVIEPAPDDTTGAGPEIDRDTWEWNLVRPDTKPLAKTKADAVLGAVTTIRAVDVDDPGAVPADYGLDQPSRTATLVLEDGAEIVLEFGADRPAEEGRQAGTWMRIRGDATIWVVTDYNVKNIFKKVDDLLPE